MFIIDPEDALFLINPISTRDDYPLPVVVGLVHPLVRAEYVPQESYKLQIIRLTHFCLYLAVLSL